MRKSITIKRLLITEIILLGVVYLGWQMTTENLIIEALGYTKGSCVGSPCFADVFPQPLSIYLGFFLIGAGLLIAIIYFSITLLRYIQLTKKSSGTGQTL